MIKLLLQMGKIMKAKYIWFKLVSSLTILLKDKLESLAANQLIISRKHNNE